MERSALEQRIAKLESSNAALKRWLSALGTLFVAFVFLGAKQADEPDDTSRVLRARELHLSDADGHEYAAILVHDGVPQLAIKHKDGPKASVSARPTAGAFTAQGLDKDQGEVALIAAGEHTQLALEYGKAEYSVGADGQNLFLITNEVASE